MNKHFRRWCCRSRLPPRLLWGRIGLCWPKGWCARLVEKITKETNGLNRLIFIIASCISRLVTREMRPEDGCFRHTDYITLFCHFCSINALLDAYHFSLGKKRKLLYEARNLFQKNLNELFFIMVNAWNITALRQSNSSPGQIEYGVNPRAWIKGGPIDGMVSLPRPMMMDGPGKSFTRLQCSANENNETDQPTAW